MSPIRTWRRASLLVALFLVTAPAAIFASNLKPDQPEHSNPSVIQVQPGPAISLMTPADESWLGLVVKDTDEAEAKELKLPHITGAIVVSVISGSPAEKAGFEPNDVILQFDGQRVRSATQLRRLIEETPANRTVKVEISRAGKLQTLDAKIEDRGSSALLKKPENPKYKFWIGPEFAEPQRPEPEPFVEPGPNRKIMPLPPVIPKFYLGPLPNLKSQPPQIQPFVEPGPQGKNRPFGSQQPAQENALGISGQNLTPQLAHYFGVKEGKGVLVTQVDKGSPASAAGLKAGDVIVRAVSQEIGSMAELQWLLRTVPNRERRVPLVVVRNHEERQMSVLLSPEQPTPDQREFKPLPIMSMRIQ